MISTTITKTVLDNNFQKEIIDISTELIKMVKNEGAKLSQKEYQESDFFYTIEMILIACETFRDFLRNEIMIDVKGGRTEKNAKIIKLGTALIFQLRKLITGESLFFVLAGNTKDNKLKEKIYSQDEIFSYLGIDKNIRVSFANAQIELSSQIERLSSLDDVNSSLASKWKKIIEWSSISEDSRIDTDKDNNETIYKKTGPDINVYLKWATNKKKKTYTYYYMLNGSQNASREEVSSSGLSYNRGWLYQWLKMNQDIELDEGSSTPLLPLMTAQTSKLENVAGIKSGDYGLEQYKFRNRRVITLNNILDILEGRKQYLGIINSLKLLKESKNAPTVAFEKLISDFTTLNEYEIQDFTRKRIDELGLKNF